MFKEAKHNYKKVILGALVVSMAFSCSGPKKENDGLELYEKAETLSKSGSYAESNAVIDSINKAFPSEIDVVKQGMHLRTLNDEKLLLAEQALNDSLVVVSQEAVDKLSGSFVYVKEKDMVEGFKMSRLVKRDGQVTSIEPRINENGEAYIVSNFVGRSLRHTMLKAKCTKGEVVTGSVPYDNARNYRYENEGTRYESVTFRPSECASFMSFIAENCGSSITIVFCGSANQSIGLGKNVVQAISDTYKYAEAASNLKKAQGKKIYLQKKLEIVRRQQKATEIK